MDLQSETSYFLTPTCPNVFYAYTKGTQTFAVYNNPLMDCQSIFSDDNKFSHFVSFINIIMNQNNFESFCHDLDIYYTSFHNFCGKDNQVEQYKKLLAYLQSLHPFMSFQPEKSLFSIADKYLIEMLLQKDLVNNYSKEFLSL